jgi:hypothetical protein
MVKYVQSAINLISRLFFVSICPRIKLYQVAFLDRRSSAWCLDPFIVVYGLRRQTIPERFLFQAFQLILEYKNLHIYFCSVWYPHISQLDLSTHQQCFENSPNDTTYNFDRIPNAFASQTDNKQESAYNTFASSSKTGKSQLC